MAYIFFTSPTSGTAAMQRILTTVARKRRLIRMPSPAATAPEEGKTFVDPDAGETIYWFQGPRHWNPELDLSRFDTIVNFRDPRDLACNQYWWALQHPNDKDPPEVAAEKRRKVEERGIDHYVVNKKLAGLYDIFLDLGQRPDSADATFTSYAQLCCAFDYMVDNLCRVFDRRPSEVVEPLRAERPENLVGNPEWVKIGGTWAGSDISPGRFRRDLSEEAADKVTVKYERELAFCRDHDAPFLGVHYIR